MLKGCFWGRKWGCSLLPSFQPGGWGGSPWTRGVLQGKGEEEVCGAESFWISSRCGMWEAPRVLGRRWGNGLASLAGTGQGGVSVLPCIRQWWTRCASATGANCAHTWLCHFAGPVPSCPCSWAFCPWLAAWTTELGLPASCQGAPGHSLGLGCKPGQCCLPSCRSWSSDCLRQLKSLSSDGVLCKKPGALVHPISKSEFLNTTAVEGGLK